MKNEKRKSYLFPTNRIRRIQNALSMQIQKKEMKTKPYLPNLQTCQRENARCIITIPHQNHSLRPIHHHPLLHIPHKPHHYKIYTQTSIHSHTNAYMHTHIPGVHENQGEEQRLKKKNFIRERKVHARETDGDDLRTAGRQRIQLQEYILLRGN